MRPVAVRADRGFCIALRQLLEMDPLEGPAVLVKMASPAVFRHHDGEIPLI